MDFQPVDLSSTSSDTNNVGRSVPSPSRSTSNLIRSRLNQGTRRDFNVANSGVTSTVATAPKLSANMRFADGSWLHLLGESVPVNSKPFSALPGSPDIITTVLPETSNPA